jgi:hypothetical protein
LLQQLAFVREVFGKQPSRFVGEPSLATAEFYSNHGRIKEAETLYRKRLAQLSLNGEERLNAIQQLVGFLCANGSKTEALAM